jgi:hypothetical protein
MHGAAQMAREKFVVGSRRRARAIAPDVAADALAAY